MTEGRSTGIPKILQAMKQNGSPSPEFDFDADHTFFMCRLPIHPQATMPEGLAAPVGVQAGRPVAGQVTAEVTAEVNRLLQACEGILSRHELQDRVGIKHDEHFRIAYVIPALETGLIAMTIPDKPRSSRQKYRLTHKGRAWLASAKP